jgi:hypothetical protein
LFIAAGMTLAIFLECGPVALADAGLIIVALIVALVIIFAPPLVALVVHEAGHVMAGWLVGFRLQAVRVGNLRIAREGDNLRTRWQKRAGKNRVFLGSVQSWPSDDHNLRVRIAVLTAGGPTANLLFSALCICGGVARVIRHPLLEHPPTAFIISYVLSAMPFLFGWLSLWASIKGLLIWRKDGLQSDGAILLPLLRGGEQADLLCAQWALLGMAKNAIPVGLWPPSVIEKAAALSRGNGESGLLLIAYRALLERGDVSSAGKLLTRVLTAELSLSTDLLTQFWAEGAYLAARYGGKPPVARALLEKAQALCPGECISLRQAEVAVRIAEEEGPVAPDRATLRLKICTRDRELAEKQQDDSWIEELSTLLSSTSPDPRAEAAPLAPEAQSSAHPA